jgi:hypothetical protein
MSNRKAFRSTTPSTASPGGSLVFLNLQPSSPTREPTAARLQSDLSLSSPSADPSNSNRQALDFDSASAILTELETMADSYFRNEQESETFSIQPCVEFLDSFEQFLLETAPSEDTN